MIYMYITVFCKNFFLEKKFKKWKILKKHVTLLY